MEDISTTTNPTQPPKHSAIGRRKLLLVSGSAVVLILVMVVGYMFWSDSRSTVNTYNNGELSVQYPKWQTSSDSTSTQAISDVSKVEIEISHQAALNLPLSQWVPKVTSAVEASTGLKKTDQSISGDTATLKFSGKKDETPVTAQSQVRLAGLSVFVLTFVSADETLAANQDARDAFFDSIKILKKPVAGEFALYGTVIKNLSDTKILVSSNHGEVVVMELTSATKISHGKDKVSASDLKADVKFGATGDLKDGKLASATIVILDN